MRPTRWLLVIDVPDERINRSEYDHMHSWFESESEAQQVRRLLAEQIGGDHRIINPPAICPRCGSWPQT